MFIKEQQIHNNYMETDSLKYDVLEAAPELVQSFVSTQNKTQQVMQMKEFKLLKAQAQSFSCDLSSMIVESRKIKPKMIKKIVSWMEKLCQQTLEFSIFTLELSVRILTKYLSIVDEPVASLQLLGCACIYLASKSTESTIVASESYEACSMNIFNKEDLEEKERKIYQTLLFNTDIVTFFHIYQLFDAYAPLSQSENEQILVFFSQFIKDVSMLQKCPIKLYLYLGNEIRLKKVIPSFEQIKNALKEQQQRRK